MRSKFKTEKKEWVINSKHFLVRFINSKHLLIRFTNVFWVIYCNVWLHGASTHYASFAACEFDLSSCALYARNAGRSVHPQRTAVIHCTVLHGHCCCCLQPHRSIKRLRNTRKVWTALRCVVHVHPGTNRNLKPRQHSKHYILWTMCFDESMLSFIFRIFLHKKHLFNITLYNSKPPYSGVPTKRSLRVDAVEIAFHTDEHSPFVLVATVFRTNRTHMYIWHSEIVWLVIK